MNNSAGINHAAWLLFFRVNVAGIALLHFLAIQPDFTDLYSYSGYIYPDIMDLSTDQVSLTLVRFQELLNQWHVGISYEALLWVCRIAYPVSLVCLLLGLLTRVNAVIALFLQLLLIKSIHLYEYGVDGYTTFALFYCCIFPVGRVYSLDNRWRRPNRVPEAGAFLFLLRAHLCIAYFFSGFDKIIGPSWRNGEALWKALHSHNYYSVFPLDFLAATPFFVVSGWLTVVLEMGYFAGMNNKYTRKYWLAGIVALHLFIALFMGLFFFSALLIVLNLSAYLAPYVRQEKLQPHKQEEMQLYS
ncbi:hypothetical protein SAMN05444266_101294 [Chitinophaga jiangningensis]|uniref:HTTM-like domain-containing protein n=1 Tax=Chitinophaga jiangningensis TaxID=1419482 RepID=A0A1M6VP44_9BACT|nr:hypothetical protein [Chitinophaga jiangningensis]SHK83219.1 hypothetical protein SAMN05444266_101294 [Chitinophaga jiangningensis]